MPPVPSALPPTERICHASPDGRHSRLDLSDLRWLPTAPFCAWCGLSLDEARPARLAATPSGPTGRGRPRPGGPGRAVSRPTERSRRSPGK